MEQTCRLKINKPHTSTIGLTSAPLEVYSLLLHACLGQSFDIDVASCCIFFVPHGVYEIKVLENIFTAVKMRNMS